MIVSKTPLRVSFFGGGSDIPQFYNRKPGMVISTSINRHIQIALNRCKTDHVRAIYSKMEVVDTAEKIEHDRIRESLKYFNVNSNIEICSFSDVPTKGTGLGSSSTFTVGLTNALYKMQKIGYNKSDLAELACLIEINLCGDPIGKQDQYAATYGGFNVIRFDSSGVEVTPINVGSRSLEKLNENLLCYSTGNNGRSTSDILSDQVKNLETEKSSAFNNTSLMVDIAEAGLKYLKNNKIDDFGSLLNESWMLKRKLSSKISTTDIDLMYEIATSAGALGGKLLGAGGGGYMLFYVPESRRNSVTLAMREFRRFHFNFTDYGSTAVEL